jgi:hypothetical protein
MKVEVFQDVPSRKCCYSFVWGNFVSMFGPTVSPLAVDDSLYSDIGSHIRFLSTLAIKPLIPCVFLSTWSSGVLAPSPSAPTKLVPDPFAN